MWVTPASLSLFSGQTTSLYTHAGGIKAITANAALSLRAHTDAQQIWSQQDLTVQSTTDEVRIQASESITLTAGHSQIVIEGGNVSFICPGTWTVKAASHDWAGGGRGEAVLPLLPSGQVGIAPDPARHDQFFVLRWANSGRPMKNQAFRLRRADGGVQSGTTDANGRSPILDTASKEELLTVELLREQVTS